MRDLNSSQEHEQELIGSLLDSLYENNTEQAQALVTAGLNRIDGDESEYDQNDGNVMPPKRFSFLPRWAAFGLATSALIMIAFMISQFDTSRNAMAAVVKSLDQAFADIGRHYSIETQIRINGKSVSKELDLYVKGGDRFAIRLPGPLHFMGNVWLGSSGDRAWVVPPVGPIVEGEKLNLFAWVQERRDEISTPYLHITTALERMRDVYELEFLEDETIAMGEKQFRCQRIAGKLNGERSEQTPDEFELWVDAKTGVAVKVVADWNLPEGASGRDSVVILLESHEKLDDAFFTSKAHEGSRPRPRISFSKENASR